MKTNSFLLLLLICLPVKILAQTNNFDVFTYNEPKEWKKDTKPGVVVYTTGDEKKATYCMIAIYASRTGSGNSQQDFAEEWKKIAAPLGAGQATQQQDGGETAGWHLVTGTGTFKNAAGTAAAMLNTFSANNKTASLLFVFNDAGYQKTLEDFSVNVKINPPPSSGINNQAPASANTDNVAGGFSYTPPKDWTVMKNTNGSVSIASPLLECKDYSYYTIHLPGKVTYAGSLQQYAHDLHKSNFYQQNDWRQYMEGDKRIVKGIDANGHEFLSFETSAALFNSDRNYHYGMVYLLRSGNQMIPILLELRPLNGDRNAPPTEILYFLASCNQLRSAWNKFISSIKFATEQGHENYLPDDLLGKWESRIILGATNWGLVNSQVLEKYTFMDDGRYQSAKMFAANSYGKYSVNGNKLTITDAAGKTTNYNFKLESKFEYGSWHRELSLYDATGKESILKWEGE
jgi:hypothetical protein